MSRPLKLKNMTEEFQDFIADESGLGYVVATNFTAENHMDFTDIGRLMDSQVLLTIFDEGGSITQSSKLTMQDRRFRFVAKGTTASDALDRCRDLLIFLWNKKTFATTTYRYWIRAILRMPEVIARGESGSFLADFILDSVVFNKV